METRKSMKKLLQMLEKANEPFDERAVSMDCKDDCEEIAELAERVACGENLRDIFPEYATHLDQIECSKEEFEVLVSVLRAELDAEEQQNNS